MFFVRFFLFFFSPWKRTFFFVGIFVCSYLHQPDCHVLDKGFKYRSHRLYAKFLSISNSVLISDMDLQYKNADRTKNVKNGRKTDTA